jgi:hypothetical protein
VDFRPNGQLRIYTHAQESLYRGADRPVSATLAFRPRSLLANTGFTSNTIRLWKSKYAGMDVSDVVRLKQLETEDAQTHRIVASYA